MGVKRMLRVSWKAASSLDAGYAVHLLSAEFNPLSAKRKRPLISRTVRFTREEVGGPDIEVGEYTYGALHVVRTPEGSSNKVRIGKFCALSDLTVELRGDHHMEYTSTYSFHAFPDLWPRVRSMRTEDLIAVSGGDVVIGNDVWFGIDVTVLSGVTIGDGAVIGARSVVTRDVEPYSIVAGNPARFIRKRFDDETIRKLSEVKWWDWPIEKIDENLELICTNEPSRLLLLT